MTTAIHDGEMAAQFERIIRRVKLSMNYRGSYSTRDILGSLVARWVRSGEWQRLRSLPAEQRQIGPSVRHFLLDRLDQLRTRGEQLALDAIDLPDDDSLAEQVEIAELRTWIEDRVDELAAGKPDPRLAIELERAVDIGRAMRLALEGATQRRIAEEIGISLGLVNKLIVEGTNYLGVLQGIEHGIEL